MATGLGLSPWPKTTAGILLTCLLAGCSGQRPSVPLIDQPHTITVKGNMDGTEVTANGVAVGTGRIVTFTEPANVPQLVVEGRFLCQNARNGPAAAAAPIRRTVVDLPLKGDRLIEWTIAPSECVPPNTNNPLLKSKKQGKSNPSVPR